MLFVQADAWKAAYPEWNDAIEFSLVPELSAAGAFDEAIAGVTIVAHPASPFFYGPSTPILTSGELR